MMLVAPETSKPVVADRAIDCRGLPCPEPLVTARQAIEALSVGQVLKLTATESGAPADIREWAQRAGRELVTSGREDGAYVYYIRRTS